MLNLEFDQTTLYPAGYFTRDIPVAATVRFPDGWQAATALRPVAGAPGGRGRATARVPFETLVDSPIFAGRYMRRVPLDTSSRPVTLDIVADRPDLLAATDEQIAEHAKLVREATTLFALEALRPLRPAPRAERQAGADRPRAPPLERERLGPDLFHRVGQERQRARPAAARVHP